MQTTVRELKHYEWLVDRRSRNQKAAKDIYVLFVRHRRHFRSDNGHDKAVLANILLSIAFSLWRAVFLTGIKDESDFLEHAEAFLKNLIESNAVAYTQDFQAKNWTFRYYINNAKHQIEGILEGPYSDILEDFEIPEGTSDAKDIWDGLQTALEVATKRFGEKLGTGSAPRIRKRSSASRPSSTPR